MAEQFDQLGDGSRIGPGPLDPPQRPLDRPALLLAGGDPDQVGQEDCPLRAEPPDWDTIELNNPSDTGLIEAILKSRSII